MVQIKRNARVPIKNYQAYFFSHITYEKSRRDYTSCGPDTDKPYAVAEQETSLEDFPGNSRSFGLRSRFFTTSQFIRDPFLCYAFTHTKKPDTDSL